MCPAGRIDGFGTAAIAGHLSRHDCSPAEISLLGSDEGILQPFGCCHTSPAVIPALTVPSAIQGLSEKRSAEQLTVQRYPGT